MPQIIPIKKIKVEHGGVHLCVSMKINGKNARMILDTGASRSVFDYHIMKKFVSSPEIIESEILSAGIGTTTMKSHFITFAKLQLGKRTIENYNAVLLDLEHVNTAYTKAGIKKIDGILGGDILLSFKAIIDYSKMELKISLR